MSEFETVIGPGAKNDYSIDWSPVLSSGETLTGSTWATSGVDVDLDAFDDNSSSVRIENAVAWTFNTATNTVTTSAGRTLNREVVFKCRPIRE
jgi:hypothetical protein